ncbi:dimethyl sulfoxide reductase anchor subunit [Ruficoccus amylovorans]|uniref:Dimethyl sulfoxide reductase anchor subunit n=1 Tax=Ruficoccus amylovorans TaxID=1804625 RepID=A0A842HGC9_9BACT|nr:DmsC/YnfH family molybdoenzyme membrane anchor subunit [Ruficoccus amylovorans]MBC2595472.1 dimethyl sulfoxide reductase anchor subunit [Ruficoccus amylovorans]
MSISATATVELTPVERLLREQGRLETPVAEFARAYERGQQESFRQLIPLDNPGAGEQFAFEVDLDRCTGCKACVAACHNLNGLDAEETWRDVGLLHGQSMERPYLQTVTTACHHCADPGCLNGCPVNAYEKDALTGIVLHLDDQCIGCQYCVLKCPYDVPKYNERLGIVRKCDMCYQRLSQGEPPACVQACPTEAIRIVTVEEAAIRANAAAERPAFLPGSPHQRLTAPATRYVSARPIPADAQAADAQALRPQETHWPLVFMLALTQVSVGFVAASLFADSVRLFLLLAASMSGMAGLGASVLHLGKPLKAWRAFVGLGHSWLSREIVVFGLYAPALLTLTALTLAPTLIPTAADWPLFSAGWLTRTLALTTLGFGLAGVFTSVMIYHDTGRPFWRFDRTAVRFAGTVLLTFIAAGVVVRPSAGLALCLTLVWLAKALPEAAALGAARSKAFTPARHSACIQLFRARTRLMLRWSLSLAGLLLVLAGSHAPASISWMGVALLIGGEIAERSLFFRAVAAPKMPGGIAR